MVDQEGGGLRRRSRRSGGVDLDRHGQHVDRARERVAGAGGKRVRRTVVTRVAARARPGSTAKYVTIRLAKQNGYAIITRMIPNMGYHFMNPKVKGFDLAQAADPRLRARRLELAARGDRMGLPLEARAATAAGREVRGVRRRLSLRRRHVRPATAQAACPAKSPQTGLPFNFWHPTLVTMHVWLWYPNPTGLFASTNPLVTPSTEASATASGQRAAAPSRRPLRVSARAAGRGRRAWPGRRRRRGRPARR